MSWKDYLPCEKAIWYVHTSVKQLKLVLKIQMSFLWVVSGVCKYYCDKFEHIKPKKKTTIKLCFMWIHDGQQFFYVLPLAAYYKK